MIRVLLLSSVVSSLVAVVVALAVTSVAIPRVAEAQGSVVKAEWVGVVGADGVEQVRLQVRPTGGGQIHVLDASGTTRVAAGTGGPSVDPNPANAGVNVNGIDGTRVARMGTLAPGGRGLVVNDEQGNNRIRLFVAPDGTPGIWLLDADGNATWSTP